MAINFRINSSDLSPRTYPAQDVDAAQQDIDWAFDFDPQPGDDLGLEPATDEEDVHMIDGDTATPHGSSDASVSPSSSASVPNHDDDEDLVAADLPLFFDDQDDDDDDGSDEERSGREDNGNSSEGSDNNQMEADADLHQPNRVEQDRPPQSRHGQQLLDDLIGEYRPGPRPHGAPRAADVVVSLEDLDSSQKATVRHFRTFIRKDLTVAAYIDIAKNTEDAAKTDGVKIMSQFKAASYVKRITKLDEQRWDMCKNSCMAFVGPNADLRRCTASRNGAPCREPRYHQNGKAKKTFVTVPILPRARAKWATGAASTYLQERAVASIQQLKDGDEDHVFLDFADGAVMWACKEKMGLFQGRGEKAYMLSVDGAQMVERKESNGWIVLLTCLNTPSNTRFRRKETFVASVIPGPNNPVDVDSFLWPIMQEFAKAARGHWLWDGKEREWFLWKAYLVFAAADQPGSQKVSHMTGTAGYSGCRVCHMVANYVSGQVTGYFPLASTGQNDDPALNVDRLQQYDPQDLPLRDDNTYADALEELAGCLTGEERAETRKLTGVSARPVLAASPAFLMPSFFPVDIFHLFGMNILSLLWEVFINPKPGDPFSLSVAQQERFARLLSDCGKCLPGSFSSGLPRDPTEFSKSHYKMFEWSLALYTFFPPFLQAIGAPEQVIEMISQLQAGVRLASSINGCTEEQRLAVRQLFISFAKLWERLYIRGQTELVYRATISIHYLLHVADYIYWHGSVIISSQARCEREAGLIKKSIRSFKSVFANIMNNVLQREHMRILDLILQDEEEDEQLDRFRLTVKIQNSHRALTEDERTQQRTCSEALVGEGVIDRVPRKPIVRGRINLPSGHMLRCNRTESDKARIACRFMAREGNGVMYAEALHFLCLGGQRNSDGKEAEVLTDSAYALACPLPNV
ncbi:hypothetical protein A4X09_0g7575 [Tilletia walkeri]|uniref:Uncharacterized protein n=1 Tax=Tilletia walkeri TaxID=117179 RepID=A0A8X7N381_9BASI|nr:hypothetical protein A4X09_0g7575 [Tilletia walkeri]